MCGVCGCGEDEQHQHDHERLIKIEKDVLTKNDAYAEKNRDVFTKQGIAAMNLVSSPGSGKTTLLVKTINALKEKITMAVIEGDQQTTIDADRIAATHVPVKQINTGKGCHLDAHAISHAVHELGIQDNCLLFIENVGNLVCPALFDLGEKHRIVILSVTEGDDKPLKYPHMFHSSDLMLINKIDLLPYVQFDIERCIDYAKRLNPQIKVFQLSATTGEGMNDWYQWLCNV